MDRDQLVMGIAAVFAGVTMLLVVLGFSYSLFLLFLAVPFGAATYFMWYQASGRLSTRTRTRRVNGFGAGARRAAGQRQGQRRGRGRGQSANPADSSGPSRTQAYRTLDLDPGASQDAIKRAYRSKVKQVHPDTDGGDEETFKRVNRAYERLSD